VLEEAGSYAILGVAGDDVQVDVKDILPGGLAIGEEKVYPLP
jgi:hypothetical protein